MISTLGGSPVPVSHKFQRMLAAAVLLGASACVFPLPIGLKRTPETWEAKFYRDLQGGEILNVEDYSADERVALYLYGALNIHPAVYVLADSLAGGSEWQELLPPIQERLQTSLEDDELFELIHLLEMMTRNYQRDLRGEAQLLEALDRAVNWISAPYEDMVGRRVDAIRAGPQEP